MASNCRQASAGQLAKSGRACPCGLSSAGRLVKSAAGSFITPARKKNGIKWPAERVPRRDKHRTECCPELGSQGRNTPHPSRKGRSAELDQTTPKAHLGTHPLVEHLRTEPFRARYRQAARRQPAKLQHTCLHSPLAEAGPCTWTKARRVGVLAAGAEAACPTSGAAPAGAAPGHMMVPALRTHRVGQPAGPACCVSCCRPVQSARSRHSHEHRYPGSRRWSGCATRRCFTGGGRRLPVEQRVCPDDAGVHQH